MKLSPEVSRSPVCSGTGDPFIEEEDFYFLKTIIPSRKATRDYLGGGATMNNPDKHEKDLLQSYEDGELVSTEPTQKEKDQFKSAAQTTTLKDRRVNIRLSSTDLRDLQARAMEEGMPYQTLIASVIHKYVNGRFVEKPSRLTKRSERTAKKKASG